MNNLTATDHQRLRDRVTELESIVTKFLAWNGTDYADDEAREYALVGICEEAYALIPYSQSDGEVNG